MTREPGDLPLCRATILHGKEGFFGVVAKKAFYFFTNGLMIIQDNGGHYEFIARNTTKDQSPRSGYHG